MVSVCESLKKLKVRDLPRISFLNLIFNISLIVFGLSKHLLPSDSSIKLPRVIFAKQRVGGYTVGGRMLKVRWATAELYGVRNQTPDSEKKTLVSIRPSRNPNMECTHWEVILLAEVCVSQRSNMSNTRRTGIRF